MAVLGIAGTAKNTGKTTTTVALLEEVYRCRLPVAVTSIGLDGEALDQVTGLPKPRLPLKKGTLLALAEGCWKRTPQLAEVLETLPVHTPLGAVQIVRMKEDGLVMVAGPNKSHELRLTLERLKGHGAAWIFVDGALNRLAPMAETDGLILATGAARTPELDRLAEETRGIARIFGLAPHTGAPGGDRVLVGRGSQVLRQGPELPVLTGGEARRWQNEMVSAGGDWVYFPGLIGEEVWKAWRPVGTLVVRDGTKILLGGDPRKPGEGLSRLADQGGRVAVVRPLPLAAVTVNPFFPRFHPETQSYSPDQVDGEELHRLLDAAVEAPVYDVARQGASLLWQELKKEEFLH